MDCTTVQQILAAVGEPCRRAVAERLAAHLAVCPRCAAVRRGFSALMRRTAA